MGTPVPKVSEPGTGAGPVTTYRLSPEELAKYQTKEKTQKVPFTIEEYLQMRVDGKTRTRICTEHKINPNVFYIWLDRNGIKDKAAEEHLIAELRQAEEPANEEPLVETAVETQEQKDEYERPHEPTQLEREEIFTPEEKAKPKKPLFDELHLLLSGRNVFLSKDELDRMKLALDLLGLEYELETVTVIKLRRLEAGADLS